MVFNFFLFTNLLVSWLYPSSPPKILLGNCKFLYHFYKMTSIKFISKLLVSKFNYHLLISISLISAIFDSICHTSYFKVPCFLCWLFWTYSLSNFLSAFSQKLLCLLFIFHLTLVRVSFLLSYSLLISYFTHPVV